MVAVAYKKRLLTKGSKCIDVTGKVLVLFWKTGRRGEVDATGGSTALLYAPY